MLNNFIFALSTLIIVFFAHLCKRHSKEALFVWIALQCILANFFVLKQITLFGLNATASDMFAVGGILGLNILQAEYGQAEAKKAIWVSFIGMIFFCLISQAHIHYLPNQYDQSQAAYSFLLTPAPRILLGSLIAFLIVQQCDVYIFGKLKKYFKSWSFTRIATLSLIFTQGLDTILFAFLGLYGLVDQLWQVIFIGYTIKTLTILLMMSFSHFSQRWSEIKP